MAGLFWGDRPERKARRSLATALWHIRRCLPDSVPILSDAHVVHIDPHAELWVDRDEFESLTTLPDVSKLQAAVALYRGDLLEGFYDDWILPERYRLDTLFAKALARLAAVHEAKAEYDAALATAQRLLYHDPLREDAHRAAIRAHCHLGQRSAALEQYQQCQKVLKEELNAEPMVETTDLYEEVLQGRCEIGPAQEVIVVDERVRAPLVALGRSPLDALAPGVLVGRDEELAFLRGCWRKARSGRGGLVLVSGEVGVGKTRLAEEFAEQLRGQGVRVMWGRCYEFERTLPYQPIVEALRALPESTFRAAGLSGLAIGLAIVWLVRG